MPKPVVVVVRDGWGISDSKAGNAVAAAGTPVTDRLRAEYPVTVLDAAGRAVGLPEGFQGSSEVGHLNMGAGRVVKQELTRVNDGIEGGSIWDSPAWRRLVSTWRENRSTLHLLGLLQDEGVHAHQDHLFAFMRRARSEYPEGSIVLHPFLDGRDTPPRSSVGYMEGLLEAASAVGGCRLGTMMGRYYGMDRSRSWRLTDMAYDCIAHGRGRVADDPLKAIESSYGSDRTPDGEEMFDEYVPPTRMRWYRGMEPGDTVLHTNYRQDRAIQLTKAFMRDDYPGEAEPVPDLLYVGLTRYYDGFDSYIVSPISGAGGMDGILGEVLSKAGLRQLRISETQKFRHVTSFFNGKSTEPFPGEDQVEVTSGIDASSYASHPEMEAERVTDELLRRMEEMDYAFVLVNYANCDMVGHTGVFDAAVRAVETVDRCLGRLVPKLLEAGARLLVTADHGNAEQMREAGGSVQTSHSTNPVELIYVAADARERRLRSRGILSDVAPTVLELLGLPKPPEMTSESLFL